MRSHLVHVEVDAAAVARHAGPARRKDCEKRGQLNLLRFICKAVKLEL